MNIDGNELHCAVSSNSINLDQQHETSSFPTRLKKQPIIVWCWKMQWGHEK